MSLLVGLTGGMGSGKSLASSFFQDLGAFIFDEDLICTIVYLRTFNEIPEPARRYINIKAARIFVDRLVSDQGLRSYTQQDETRARSILMETDLCNADHKVLRGDPSLTSAFDTYSPANAIIR